MDVGIVKYGEYQDILKNYEEFTEKFTYEYVHDIIERSFNFLEYANDIATKFQLEWVKSGLRSIVLSTYKDSDVTRYGVDKLTQATIDEGSKSRKNKVRLKQVGDELENLDWMGKLGRHTRYDEFKFLIESEIVDESNIPIMIHNIRKMYIQGEDHKYYVGYEVVFKFDNNSHKGIEVESFIKTTEKYFNSMGFIFNNVSAGWDGYKLGNNTRKFDAYIIDAEDVSK